jgi:polar amino acid transport system substrate-binding protein
MFTRIYLLALLAMLCGSARAEGSAAPLPCGPYTVALYDMLGYYARQPDGSWAGADKDVIDALAQRTGCRFHQVLESRVRIWTMILTDKLDITVSGVATPERLAHAHFLSYMGGRNMVLLHPQVEAGIKTPEDFLAKPHYTVAVVKSFQHGATYEAWLARLRAEGRVHDAADVTATLRLLQLGRVQAIISTLPLPPEATTKAWRAMDWAPRDNIVAGLVLSKTRVRPADRERLAAGLRSMRRDGTLEAIYTRHMGAAVASILMQY